MAENIELYVILASGIAGLLTGIAGLVAGVAAYKRNKSDLITAATNAAEKAIALRERQMRELEEETRILRKKVKMMDTYVHSLMDVINQLINDLRAVGIEPCITLPNALDLDEE